MDLELTVRYGEKEKTVVWDSHPLFLCWVLQYGPKGFSIGEGADGEEKTAKIRRSAVILNNAVDEVAGPLLYAKVIGPYEGPFSDKAEESECCQPTCCD